MQTRNWNWWWLLVAVGLLVVLSGCSDAYLASRNVSKAADQFEIDRRIVFYNGITGDYILAIEGRCSLQTDTSAPDELAVICKTGADDYKKHFLGLSDNVTYFAEQLEVAKVNVYHYRVIFKPSVILPDIDVELP